MDYNSNNIKEGITDRDFLVAWGGAFKAQQGEFAEKMVKVFADAIFALENKPLKYHSTKQGVCDGLSDFALQLQKAVADSNPSPYNLRQCAARCAIVGELKTKILESTTVKVVQTSLF